MCEKEKEIGPVWVDFDYAMARITRPVVLKGFSQKIEASLVIVSSSLADEHAYTPAESITIQGNDNLRKLRDALTEALGD